MYRMNRRLLVLCLPVVLAAGCEQAKSSNPLSPSIAGPIAGVSIQAPKPADPTGSAQIAVDQQPVTLIVENASTNGVRPLSYIFEIATDAGFTTRVFSQTGVKPGDGSRTSLKLPQSLTAERTYYWRSKADDGANASDYSGSANFRVYTPVVIQPPVLRSPADGATLDTRKPTLVVTDAQRTGPAGDMQYLIEVATDAPMANRIIAAVVNEASGQTSYTVPDDLAYATRFYWRVKAADPSHQSNYSNIQSFVTPLAPVVVVPPPSGGGGGGIAAGDQIDMSQATILNSPMDLASWPVTTSLTGLDFTDAGQHPTFSKQDGPGRWPDVTPPGWSGTLQYTLGMCLNINAHWYCSAVVEFWYGLGYTGGPASDFAKNWFYSPERWAPMTGHQPSPGETIGFFVCAGDCRNNPSGSASPVKERSNIVLLQMPGGNNASFTFSSAIQSILKVR